MQLQRGMTMIMTLAEYDEYLKDGEDGKLIVIEETPLNIKTELKKINKEHKRLYAEDIFVFEGAVVDKGERK